MRFVSLAIAIILAGSDSLAQGVGGCTLGTAEATLDVNDVRANVYNHGTLFWPRPGPERYYEVPAGSGAHAFRLVTIQLGGMIGGEIRLAGTNYGPHEFWPGPLDENGRPPEDCSQYNRIYTIRKDSLLHYERTGATTHDLLEWPADLGAPIIDGDGIAGNYSLSEGDRPALVGDQMLWWVMNDAGGRKGWMQTAPLPIEIQMTAFAFDGIHDLPDRPSWTSLPQLREATFYRYRLVYRGNETLEDAWFSLWADQLLYEPQDNFIGSDSLLGLGYAYNGDDFDEAVFGDTPPAVGLDFLKGPVLLPDGLDNDSDGVVDEPGERGGATRFLMHSHNNTVDGWPRNAKEAYDLLRGIWRDGTPLTYGGQGYGGRSRAHFMYSGNPPAYWSEENAQGQGWGNSPGYRHFNISTGPFRMEPGESEDIYLGILWARGRDRLDSVRKLKAEDAVIQSIFEELIEPNLPAFTKPAPPGYALVHNYPNPFRGRTTFSYELPRQERVRLTVYDVLGREIETLVDGVQPPGVHQIEFEAGDLPPGIYFYELQAGLVRGAHKMVLLP